jgi:hypothetical protein
METKIVNITSGENGIMKISVLVTGNFAPGSFPFDYYFTIIKEEINSVKINYMGE